MGAGLKAVRAAKIWLILMAIAVFYSVRQKMGIPVSQDVSGDLNKFGETWLNFSYWVFGIALVLLILFKLGGRGAEDEEEQKAAAGQEHAGSKNDSSPKSKQEGSPGGKQAASIR